MKRLASILFLFVVLFNFYGYRMVVAYMEKENSTAMEQKLDQADYSDDELLLIKTKLHLPYYSGSPEFERAYGSVTVDGMVYDYVQKRVYNDTLELRCLPNQSKTALQEMKNDLTKATAEGQASAPVKKGGTTIKLSLPDYCQSFEIATAPAVRLQKNYFTANESFPRADFTQQQERPPQAV